MPHLPTPSRTAASATSDIEAVTPQLCRVRCGDLWQLGDHRLLCWDCTRAEDVERLMHSGAGNEAESADMLFLDPPYGVGYRNPAYRSVRPGPTVANDDLDEQGTYLLLRQALRLAPLKPGGAFYICAPSGHNEGLFRQALRDAGLPLRQTLIWVKHHFTLSRQDYQWRHEVLLYGWKPGAGHYFVADRTQTTIWEMPRPQKSPQHPTMKPLELVKKAIENSSQTGEIVFDGFGGSGTTLLACEQTRRKCRLMEIEPVYCEVILQRWEQETGRKAVLLNV